MRDFWSRTKQVGECLEWTGAKQRDRGYGRVRHEGRTEGAHRVAWILTNGPIPDGMWVLHHCDNRLCVRPEHLHLGDNAENMREMASRGRHVPGRAKVTVSQVREARAMRLDGTPVRAIAEHLGVAYSTTRSIINRTTWKGVE